MLYFTPMRVLSPLGMDSLESVTRLVSRAITALDAQGIPQWDEIYPNRDTFASDIGEGTLYGLTEDGALAGIIVLSEFQDVEYGAVDWQLKDDRPLVIHRLCVDPLFQGTGLARVLMNFAEDYARGHGYRSVRLDAFTQNPVSIALYRSLRFTERGFVQFRKGRVICFEKILV